MLGCDNMDYRINDFEGPLDLLLHLIKESEVNICDINIVDITDQYMNFIKQMEELNLNIASEYLVMAAELIEIKSITLLPRKNKELENEEYEEDPREQLINRLLEYEKYKNITTSLKEYELERKKMYDKEPLDLSTIIDIKQEINEQFKIEDLMEALNKVLIKKELDKPLSTKVATKEYSVTERSSQIRNILKAKKQVQFTELFDIMTKDYIVVTFLSILTMARNQELNIKQDKNFDNILIEGKGEV